jgi:hypothetical protein
MMRERLVSEGLSLSVLSLAGDQRQLPYGDDYKEYVVHLDSGFAIHCIDLRPNMSDEASSQDLTLLENWD